MCAACKDGLHGICSNSTDDDKCCCGQSLPRPL